MPSKYSLDRYVKVQDHLVERNCKSFGLSGSFTRDLKTTLNRKTIDYFGCICLQKYSLDRYKKVQGHPVERNCKVFGRSGSFTRALKSTSNRQTIDYFWTSQSIVALRYCFIFVNKLKVSKTDRILFIWTRFLVGLAFLLLLFKLPLICD